MTANIWVVVGLISMLAICYPIAIVVGCGLKAIPKMMMKIAIWDSRDMLMAFA